MTRAVYLFSRDDKSCANLVEHDGQEHDHLHVCLVGGGGRPQGDPICGGVHHQPQGGCPAHRATPTAPPALRVPSQYYLCQPIRGQYYLRQPIRGQ